MGVTYLPIDGSKPFYEAVGQLCFGKPLWEASKGKISAAQTVGGTGALRTIAELLAQEGMRVTAVPDPTWPNHLLILERAGHQVEKYPYYHPEKRRVDFEALLQWIEKAPEKSTLLLHASCHNPSGCDLREEQWRELGERIKRRRLFPFFDMAYQGFGQGIDKDAFAVRHFLATGHEMAVAYSCAKNFGLYNFRVGAVFVVSSHHEAVSSQIRPILRSTISNPPAQGARIVTKILSSPSLTAQWLADVSDMRTRIVRNREELVKHLKGKGIDASSILDDQGMFSYLGLSGEQVARLAKEWGVYVLDFGRINVAGIHAKNIDPFVESLYQVCLKSGTHLA
jgi:aspartate/tyrosine/aromatic aminotransferase